MQSRASIFWLFKMAWRDSRRNFSRLLLFISSIILGIGALVAIQSFGDNLGKDIKNQAKELLGADLQVSTNQNPEKSLLNLIDSIQHLGKAKAEEVNFGSMVYFPKTKGTRLVQVRALKGNFPFYGKLETSPLDAQAHFQQNRFALVDQTMLIQFKAKIGDSLRIGQLSFLIVGQLNQAPGQSGISATIAPRIYIPLQYLKETGLVQKGSRLNYNYYFQFTNLFDTEQLVKQLEKKYKKEHIRFDTVERRKENLGNVFQDLTRFLNLVAFIALLLGCVGVASAVQVYMQDKIATVAVLRCLGASGRQAFLIFLIQIAGMGLLGSLLGVILGAMLQLILPLVFQNFIPLKISNDLSISAILAGLGIGLGVSLLFAMLPLLQVRKISPLRAIRAALVEKNNRWDGYSFLVYFGIGGFIWAFVYWQLGLWLQSLYFSGFLLLTLGILWTLAKILMWAVRRFFPVSWNYLWRQSLANLYRPHNQTITLIISIGLGTALISTLYFMQGILISQIALSDKNNQPNMILFDIQTAQKEKVKQLTQKFKLPIIQDVPIVAMKISDFKGKNRLVWLNDTTENRIPRDVLNRDYRVTYRDTLANNERLVKGNLGKPVKSPDDTIFISMEEFHARRMKAKIGDEVVFNVQGTLIKTYIGSFRKLDFNSFQTSFTIVFPRGVLEEAPQFHVLMTRLKDKKVSANFQQTVVQQFPNVMLIDISLVLETAQDVLNQISFVIRFMALFSIFTGILVLIGSIIISKYQRIQESVLLRTLGASRRQIFWITALEYWFLGSLASLAGIALALLGSWILAVYFFEIRFNPDYTPVIWLYLIISSLTVLIGLFNSRSILNRPPLEVLRSEVG